MVTLQNNSGREDQIPAEFKSVTTSAKSTPIPGKVEKERVRRHKVSTSLARKLDLGLISVYFLSSPLLLALAYFLNIEFMNYGAVTWRAVIIYGVAAPFCGYLFLRTSPRARSAAYIYLTFDIYRSLVASHFLPLAFDAGLLMYLQTRRMRSIYPPLKKEEILARLRGRLEWARTLSRLLRGN